MTPGPRDCSPWREELSAHIDGELEPQQAAALERHLVECPTCRADRAELEELSRTVAADLRGLMEEAPAMPMGRGPRPLGAPTAPDAPTTARTPRGVEGRPVPMALQVAAGLLFLLFAGAWLLDGTDTALRARAADVAADLARPGTRLLVHGHPPEVVFGQQEPPALAPGQELAHLFAHGPRGAYLWQLADPDGASFDEGRYLVGSDGSQLWTWDPDLGTGRTLAVSAVPDPLPRTLARVLAELEEYTLLARGETRGRGPWREVEVALGSEAEDPTVRFLFTAEGVLVGLEFLPRPDLAVFVEPLPGSSSAPTPTASFALTTHAGPDPEAILALEAPPQPQPDVLWQLGYTPGAPPATWPEQLSALAQELGALGYL